jgi:hypothetical protein
MGRSFYLAKSHADLYAGSNTFSNLISSAYASYGLSQAQAQDYAALNATYGAAFLLAQAPQTRTRSTLQDRNDAAIPLVAKAAELAKIIDATPTVTNSQKVALGLSVRATPSPMPPPGTPDRFKVTLLADGSVQSKWKANNPAGMTGVTYQIWRRFGSVGEFTFVGASGEKKYIDSTIPAGTSQVQYQIRGIRPTSAGEWAQFNVNFGMTSGGQMTASVTEGTPVQLAA